MDSQPKPTNIFIAVIDNGNRQVVCEHRTTLDFASWCIQVHTGCKDRLPIPFDTHDGIRSVLVPGSGTIVTCMTAAMFQEQQRRSALAQRGGSGLVVPS